MIDVGGLRPRAAVLGVGAGRRAAGFCFLSCKRDARFTDGAPVVAAAAEEPEAPEEDSRGYLFAPHPLPESVSRCFEVKNLSFDTSEEALKQAFRKCKGFRSATIMRKKQAVKKGKQED